MTIKELIETLKQFSPDREIYFSYPSGDYWGRWLVKQVNNVEETPVHYSTYHESLVESGDDHDFEKEVIIIN